MFTKFKFYEIYLYIFVFTKLVLPDRICLELMAHNWYTVKKNIVGLT